MYFFIKTRIILFVVLMLIALSGYAQTPKTEILTNKNVIEIMKAGLGKDIIISKINSSSCKFDVSTTALIDLKKQGVSDDVITTMINKTNSISTVDRPTASTVQTRKSSQTVINQLNYVHYSDKGNALPLEKSLGSSKSKKLAFGYKGTLLMLEIQGATSPVKLDDAKAKSFIINTGSNNTPDLVLYKLKTEKDKRYAVVGKLTTSGPKSGEDMMPIEFSKLGDGLYAINPGTKLAKGEYFFTSKPNLNLSISSSDVFAFTLQ